MGTIITPILQMRKPRHTDMKWKISNTSPDSLAPEPLLSTSALHGLKSYL